MQKRYQLSADVRSVTGKKVKQLRAKGILPLHLYGAGTEPMALQADTKTFMALYKEAGANGLTDLTIAGEVHPILIQDVQYDYVKRVPIHADLLQVNLKEKLTSMVPVVLEGESPAVTEGLGMLMQVLSEVEVEALPTNLPESFVVNVEKLTAVDEGITVGDLKAPEGVEILTGAEETIVKIAGVPEEVEEEPVVTEGEEGAETPEGEEGTEGEEEKTEEAAAEESEG